LLISLSSCQQYQISPSKILEIQSREEEIINQILKNKKLETIEGLWRWQSVSGTGTIAIYKKENSYLMLSPGFEKELGVDQIRKISEINFRKACTMTIALGERISGDGELLIIDDNKIAFKCERLNYMSIIDQNMSKPKPSNYVQNLIMDRVWPEDLKKHNSKF